MPAMAWREGRRGHQAMFPNPHGIRKWEIQLPVSRCESDWLEKGEVASHQQSLGFSMWILTLQSVSISNLNFSLRLIRARTRPKVIRERTETNVNLNAFTQGGHGLRQCGSRSLGITRVGLEPSRLAGIGRWFRPHICWSYSGHFA